MDLKDVQFLERDFSCVSISTDDVVLPAALLMTTPSMDQGLSREEEWCLRIHSTRRLRTAAMLLEFGGADAAKAQVLFHRFFYRNSLVEHDPDHVAMVALFISSKMGGGDGQPRRLRDVMNVYHHVDQVTAGRIVRPMRIDIGYAAFKRHLSKLELRLLTDVGYCMADKYPHGLVPVVCQCLELERDVHFVQRAFNYLNDSYQSDVCVRFKSAVIACACVHLTALTLSVGLPCSPGWWLLFDVELADMEVVARSVLALYERPKEDVSEIKNKIKLLKIQQKKAQPVQGSSPAPDCPASQVPVEAEDEKRKSPIAGGRDEVCAETGSGSAQAEKSSKEEEEEVRKEGVKEKEEKGRERSTSRKRKNRKKRSRSRSRTRTRERSRNESRERNRGDKRGNRLKDGAGKGEGGRDDDKDCREGRERADVCKDHRTDSKDSRYSGKDYRDYGKDFRDSGKDYRDYGKDHRDYDKDHRDSGKDYRDYDKDYRDYDKDHRDSGKDHRDYGKDHRDYGKDHRDYGKDYRDYDKDHRYYGKDHRDYGKDYRDYDKDHRDSGKDYRDYGKDYRDYDKDHRDYGKDHRDYGKDYRAYDKDHRDSGKDYKDYRDYDKGQRETGKDCRNYGRDYREYDKGYRDYGK